ncbi:MAG: DNA polymerase III subunit chi [Pseudomonadota bacterium]
MTKIDFYILAQDSHRSVEQLTCQLTEKAYKQNNFIYIQTQSVEQANNLDELLWKFKANSFIPHKNMVNQTSGLTEQQIDNFAYPILINTAEFLAKEALATGEYNPENKAELLINLSDKTNDFFSSFQRLVEIVSKNEQSKQAARIRFRFYKDRGYEISTHNV